MFSAQNTLEVIELFRNVFSASEGKEEGESIGALAAELIEKTDPSDLIGCVAVDGQTIVGCIFFSRFVVPEGQAAFILSPVAVATHAQGAGVGQQLIRFGLDYLRSLDVKLVFTYGAPAYYSKTGFEQISEKTVEAPFKLSQPIGWLAQSLAGGSVEAMRGPTQCVEALRDSRYW